MLILVYIDASDNCSDLGITLGLDINTNWVIKVSQLRCDFPNLAPSGCTQWFFGGMTGSVRTYNFNGELHLAEQNQNICVRYFIDFKGFIDRYIKLFTYIIRETNNKKLY